MSPQNPTRALLIHGDGLIERSSLRLDTRELKGFFLDNSHIVEVGIFDEEAGRILYYTPDEFLSRQEMSKWQRKWLDARD